MVLSIFADLCLCDYFWLFHLSGFTWSNGPEKSAAVQKNGGVSLTRETAKSGGEDGENGQLSVTKQLIFLQLSLLLFLHSISRSSDPLSKESYNKIVNFILILDLCYDNHCTYVSLQERVEKDQRVLLLYS